MNKTTQRVLVYIKSLSKQVCPAVFDRCVFVQLDIDKHEEHAGQVCCFLTDNKLVLSSDQASNKLVELGHSPLCPVKEMNDKIRGSLSAETMGRGIDVGVAILLETSDECVLLTRRSAHMRTFPGVWVPPGGHIELDETLQEAGIRELQEETGLDLDSSLVVDQEPLALWESVYPALLDNGKPSRHHIVVYLHVKIKSTSEDMDKLIKLNPDETDASFWLPLALAPVQSAPVPDVSAVKQPNIRCITVREDGGQSIDDKLSADLLERLSSKSSPSSRISSGTMFALEMWCRKKAKENANPKMSHL